MPRLTRSRCGVLALALGLLAAPPASARSRKSEPEPEKAPPAAPAWLGAELPLPLPVRGPEDLTFKGVVERQYLLFNLLAGGKQAWDAGDYARAAAQWEKLLALPELPRDVELAVRPFAAEARKRAAGGAVAQAPQAPLLPAPAPLASAAREERPVEREPAPHRKSGPAVVSGRVSGGGATGPGGAVVWLERADGSTPKPKATKGRIIRQKNKAFAPHVQAVTVGTEVEFLNEDEVFHNVFSLNKPNDFDLGLYQAGLAKTHTFTTPGPIQLLCNIHASMLGWLFVVPSPYFTQAEGDGSFRIKGVPPGEYVLHAWHEAASKESQQPVSVTEDGANVAIQVGGDVRSPAFVPDKYGKPRQVQLGY